jgi:hypothetical protein
MTFGEFIEHLERRPGMYVGEVSFDRIASYLLGYGACCAVLEVDDPLEGLHELIQCRVGRYHALHWQQGIQYFFAGNEADAIDYVFSSIRDLQRIKDERGLDWLISEFERLKKRKRARAKNPNWPFKGREDSRAAVPLKP